MQVYLNMTNLPVGSSIGPTLTLAPIPAGPISPSSISVNDLLAGIYVDVNHDTTRIRVRSTGECTNYVDVFLPLLPCTTTTTTTIQPVPVFPEFMCMVVYGEGGFGSSLIGGRFSFQAGQTIVNDEIVYIFNDITNPGTDVIVSWNSTLLRWEIFSEQFDNIQLYSNSLSVTGVLGIEWIPPFGGSSDLASGRWFAFISEGSCCNCVSFTYGETRTQDYSGTYLDCNGDEQQWSILQTDPESNVTVCTSDYESLICNNPPCTGQTTALSLTPCSETLGEFICNSYCAVFVSESGTNYVPLTFGGSIPYGTSGLFSVPYWTLTSPITSTPLYFYRIDAFFSRYVISENLDSDINTAQIYAFIGNYSSLFPSDSFPIGIGLPPNLFVNSFQYEGDGLVAIRPTCDYPPTCICASFTTTSTSFPFSAEISYTNCENEVVTETVSFDQPLYIVKRCVKIGTTPSINSSEVTYYFSNICEDIIFNPSNNPCTDLAPIP